VPLHDFRADEQSKTRTLNVGGAIGSIPAREDLHVLGCGDADAMIAHDHARLRTRRVDSDVDVAAIG
jgi:hypothetical protein